MADAAFIGSDQDFVFDDGADPRIEETVPFIGLPQPATPAVKRIFIVRTSDRSNFRRCRRRWGWQSHMKQNLGPREHAAPLWLGSGFHYALEDYHGYRKYPKPSKAFLEYVKATQKQHKVTNRALPLDWMEQTKLGVEMLDYYSDTWLIARDPLQTFVYHGVPQVEVHGLVPVPFDGKKYGYDEVLYAFTLDRVIIDEHGQLWIVEYKTAKRIYTLHYQTDPQVSAYQWLGQTLYGQPIAGVIYQQHRKLVPEAPRLLSSGQLSIASNQPTSHRHYRQALQKIYGPQLINWPGENLSFLNELAKREDYNWDHFIRRDKIQRNPHQCAAEGEKLLMELNEMLNPDLPLYPSPTRDCAPMCPFHSPCVSIDDGSDWKYELDQLMAPREAQFDSWRQYLPEAA